MAGTARSGKHKALAELGLDQAIDYTCIRFEEAIRDVDIVLDLVGGNYTFRSLDVLRPGGLLVHVPSDVLPDGLIEAAESWGVRVASILVEPDHAGLEQLSALVEAGKLRVVVSHIFPLEQAAEAHRLLEQGHVLGKVVLSV